MQRSTKSIWGAGLALTGLGLLLFTLNTEPARSALGSATGTVQAVTPMKTGHRLALAGHPESFGFVLRAPGCENVRGILQLQGKPATLLYETRAMIPASEPPYLPVYAVYQGTTPLCSYEAVRHSLEKQKRLTRGLAWGAFALAALILGSAWRQRPDA
jgi:hypothetical protein